MLNIFNFLTAISIIGILFVHLTAAVAQHPARFLAARAYDGGVGFATADFNGDGKLDVVSARADAFYLYFGDGLGGFREPPTSVFACTRYSSNAFSQPLVGDFNGDGKTDLAGWMEDNFCVGRGARTLFVLLGNGNGTFSEPIYTDVSAFFLRPTHFFAEDFNGDGKRDILVSTSEFGDSNIAIFFGNGNGRFAAPISNFISGLSARSLVVEDYNNDNRPDLAFFNTELVVLLNNGNGTFGGLQQFNTGIILRKAASGDFNGDGNLDLAAIQDRDLNPVFQIWLGNGNGTFRLGGTFTFSVRSAFINTLLSADFNRDGRADLALSISNRTIVFDGNGNGTFAPPKLYGVGGGKFFTADFNGDGWIDFGTTQTLGLQGSVLGTSFEFAVLLNLQNGEFLVAPGAPILSGGEEITVADLNNDGLKDIAFTGDSMNGEIGLILQDSSNLLSQPKRHSIKQIKFAMTNQLAGGEGIYPRTLAAGDFNQDGKVDLVVAGRAPSGIIENVIVARNDGAGNLSLLTTLSLGGLVTKVITADFNNDNILDLAFSQNRETSSSEIPAVSVAFGTGDGHFASPARYLTGVFGNGINAGDFNGDNHPDLAVMLANNKITVLLNDGSGGFAVKANYDLSATPTDLATADMNGDGKPDLVVANNFSHIADTATISVLNGLGDGTFAAPLNYQTVWLYDQKLTVDDFNVDGKPDVAVSNNGVITVLHNNGSGALIKRTLWASTGALRDITSADLDGDKRPDLITTSAVHAFTSIGFLPNITTPAVVERVTPFDFDGDGRSDISVFRPSNGAWYLNCSTAGFTSIGFGLGTDKPTPADFDGDGKTDVAVFRDGYWYITESSTNRFRAIQFGQSGDIPVPADFDGDGRADSAVFRPSNSTWYRLNSSNNEFVAFKWGTSGDKPLVGDFDGDGRSDYAVFRPSVGAWYVLKSTDNSFYGINFGISEDIPTPADYDGDGKTDISVFRPSAGSWYRINSSNNQFFGQQFGVTEDKPVAADYDGDGKADIAVFRPSAGAWYIQRSTSGFYAQQFGSNGDIPTPFPFGQ